MAVTCRQIPSEGGSYIFLQPDGSDPHGHAAAEILKRDLQECCDLVYVETRGFMPFGELQDIYESPFGRIFVSLDADPGDLSITAQSEDSIAHVAAKLRSLPSYVWP